MKCPECKRNVTLTKEEIVEQITREQVIEIVEAIALLLTKAELIVSLESLEADNLGTMRHALRRALTDGKVADEVDFQMVLFAYLKGALKTGKIKLVQEAIGIIVSELGEEYDRLFKPLSTALEYIQTEDVSILERCQQTIREVILEIVDEALEHMPPEDVVDLKQRQQEIKRQELSIRIRSRGGVS